VCVFVDPLDGTKEFVDGRLSAVQTLIGVSVYGRAVAGVMGLPFHGDWHDPSSPVQVCCLTAMKKFANRNFRVLARRDREWYHRVEVDRRASRNGPVSDLPPLSLRFVTFSSLYRLVFPVRLAGLIPNPTLRSCRHLESRPAARLDL
jgi:hypothetical protein